MSSSDIKVILRYAMLCTFITAAGLVYEAYQANWAAMAWAGLSTVISVIGYNIVSLVEEEFYVEEVDYGDYNPYNTTIDEDEFQ